MEQSKLESIIESITNNIIGIATAYATWVFIILSLPMIYGVENMNHGQNIMITLTFTVVSLLRSYVVRRWFNAGYHKAVHKLVTKHYTQSLFGGRRIRNEI